MMVRNRRYETKIGNERTRHPTCPGISQPGTLP